MCRNLSASGSFGAQQQRGLTPEPAENRAVQALVIEKHIVCVLFLPMLGLLGPLTGLVVLM